ncbi:glycosyltransferase family 1 protein [Corynebacterium sp.]|uniref:glycosyltransferase family 1 protein n=1 Tax=Corynebacterium sp. TaxID=1720 RepID=UPI0026E01728|nr:glycosyltransferase family 1 protein [Corynebacterium sp.]MDO5513152.1 glycosyltransferase family 1 protein [Corynebacterium sp.]
MRPDGGVDTVDVLSIPAGHVYTDAIRPAGTRYRPDPDIDGNWWPHPALDAAWWHALPAADLPDLVHLHFGFDHLSVPETRALTEALRRRGVPLVLTVHDLDNPHFLDQREHHAKLRLLIDAATTLITLTADAAARLRPGTHVIPHPRVVADPPRATGTGTGVGVFLKSLRANVITDPVFYRILARTVHRATGEMLRVHLHEEARTAHLTHALAREQEAGVLDLKVHRPMSDEALYRAVGQCAVVLLPYQRGTHSGWLEMCRDLGVVVAAPDCGMYAGQADDPRAVASYRTGDPLDAARAIIDLHEQGPLPFTGDREIQLAQIRDAHDAVYRQVVGR